MRERHFNPSKKSYFIFGPRGTGKSTYTKSHYQDALIIDLLEPDTYAKYKKSPERLKNIIQANPQAKTIIIDEVQKIPALLSSVHQLIEDNKDLRFILTGSSARKLKREGVDLLAGRAQLKHFHPFMLSELGKEHDLDYYLTLGTLPLVIDSIEPEQDLKTYIALYIREEVITEGLIRKTDSFYHFLDAISFSQGCAINCTSIARDCHVSSHTVNEYIQILIDLLIGVKLPIFTKKAKRDLCSHPKFYYFDAGVYRSIRPSGPLDDTSMIAGQTLETLVMQHLRAWIDYSSEDASLYFWRTSAGLEVDFILYGEKSFYAIEVKNSDRIRPKDLKGLRAFKEDYPQATPIILYRGNERIIQSGIICLPVEDFLTNLIPNNTLTEIKIDE